MSFLSVAFFPAAEMAAGSLASAGRPLLGAGALFAFAMMFRPLLLGLLRAALLFVKPRKPLAERVADIRARSLPYMQRKARDYEASHPSLAAEMRFFTRN